MFRIKNFFDKETGSGGSAGLAPVTSIGSGDPDRDILDNFYKNEGKSDDKPADKSRGASSTEDDDSKDGDDENQDDSADNLGEEDEENEGEGKEKDTEDGDGDEDEDTDLDETPDLDVSDESLYSRLKSHNKNIFKEVPGLRTVLFREQKFTEIYPTVDEATQAKDAADTFQQFQEDIERGDSSTLVQAVSNLGEEKLNDFASSFLPALAKTSRETYFNVLAPEFKRMLQAASKNQDERISAAAKNIHYFLFNTANVDSELQGSKKEDDPEKKRLIQERNTLEQKQLQTFVQDVQTVATNRAKKIITNSLKELPVSEWTRKNMVNDIYNRVAEAMEKDVRYNGQMKNLWNKARTAGLTSEGKDSIINTFLSRAKSSIPKYRQQILNEAKVTGSEAGKDGKKSPTRIPSASAVGKGGNSNQQVNPKDVDWDKTSERDYLDGKIVLKKKS